VSLGFKRASSDEVLPIEKCLLIPDEMNELLPQIELEAGSAITRIAMRIDSEGEIVLVFEGKSDEPLNSRSSCQYLQPISHLTGAV